MILVGELSLWVALLMAAWCAVVSIAGGIGGRDELRDSGERAAYATFAFTALAAAGLWTALARRDFSYEYVASRISDNMPHLYVFTAFWSGPAGAMLLWALMLALCSAVAVWVNRAADRARTPYVTGTLGVVLVLFLAATALASNPFARLDPAPLDGQVMDPLLQNPGMAMHPPALFLGLAATTIPFAFTLGALAGRRADAQWLVPVRRWTLVSWLFLTVGIVLGMWWAYVEPGSGDRWARDPVANLSLLPWLASTAFLYTVARERGGVPSKWSVALPVATFLLALLGPAIGTGGIIARVHSFAQSPVVGWLSAFLVVAVTVGISLLATRLPTLELQEQRLMASKHRRYGVHVAHAGFVLLVAALTGLAFRREYNVSAAAGQAFEVEDPYGGRWRFMSQGISNGRAPNHEITSVTLEASRNGRPAGLITSERRQYLDSHGHPVFEPTTEAGVRSRPGQDVYVELAAVRGDAADIRVSFNPLMVWVWIGGGMVALGGLLAMWPRVGGSANA